MVLTKEILGPVIAEAQRYSLLNPPFETDKNWLRVAAYVLDKLQNIALHHYHGHGPCNGDTRTHYMYKNYLIETSNQSTCWVALDSKTQVLSAGDETWVRNAVDSHVARLKGNRE